MRPASARFAAAILVSHRVAVEAVVLRNGAPIGLPLSVADGSVSLDGTAQVRGSLSLKVADKTLMPTSPTSLLAPYGNELSISRGIAFPDGSRELIGLGVFRIEDADPDGQVIAITGQDRSARIADARFEEPYQVAAGTLVRTAILNVIQAVYPEVQHDLGSSVQTVGQAIAEEGADRWQFAQELGVAAAQNLYFDGAGVLRLTSPSTTSPVAFMQEGPGSVLLSAGRRWQRAGTSNRVIVTGEGTGEGAPARGIATDNDPNSPTYYLGSFGRVPRFYSSSLMTTDAQCAAAAATLLARELGTTQKATFGSIVDPRLEPSDIIRITRLASGIDEDNTIEQLTIPLTASESMSGNTRAKQVFT